MPPSEARGLLESPQSTTAEPATGPSVMDLPSSSGHSNGDLSSSAASSSASPFSPLASSTPPTSLSTAFRGPGPVTISPPTPSEVSGVLAANPNPDPAGNNQAGYFPPTPVQHDGAPHENEDEMEALWTEYFKDKRGEVKKWIEKVEKDKQGKIRRTVKWVTRNKKKGCNIDIEGVLDLMEHPEKFQSEMEDMIKSIYDPDEKGVESASKVTRRLRRCGLGMICAYSESPQFLREVIGDTIDAGETLPMVVRLVCRYKGQGSSYDLAVPLFNSYLDLCYSAIDMVSRKANHNMNLGLDSTKEDFRNKRKTFKDKRGDLESTLGWNYREILSSRVHEIYDKLKSDGEETQRWRDKIDRKISALKPENKQWPPIATAKLPVQILPMPDNKKFIGRKNELDMLKEYLIQEEASDTAVRSCLLRGLGGFGKTEVALRFAYSSAERWHAGIFWVTADITQEAQLTRAYCDIGRTLGILSADEDDDRQIETVRGWFETTDKRWLLIFDGFQGYDSPSVTRHKMDRLWPSRASTSGCAILVTSQNEVSENYAAKTITMEPMTKEDALKLLLVPNEEDSAEPQHNELTLSTAAEICHELGHSPLNLWLARGYILFSNMTLEEYLDEFRATYSLPASDAVDGWSSERYDKKVRAALDLNLKLVVRRRKEARQFLNYLAFMNPEDISYPLLHIKGISKVERMNAQQAYNRYIIILVRCGLIMSIPAPPGGDKSLRMHRAVQLILHEKMREGGHMEAAVDTVTRGDTDAAFNEVIRTLRSHYPQPSELQIADAGIATDLLLVLPHVMTIRRCLETNIVTGNSAVAKLLSDVGGMDCYDRGLIKEAYELNEVVRNILEKRTEEGTKRLLSNALTIQGLCTDFMALSKRAEGLKLRRECLEIRDSLFNKLPPGERNKEQTIRLYNSHTDLVCSLQQINDFAGVTKHLKICFDKYKELGNEEAEPYEYSKYYNQMAYVHLYNGKPDEAIKSAERGHELAEKAAPGTNYPYLYRFDYVNILFQHGDHREEAFKLLQEVIKSHSAGQSLVYSEILASGMKQNLGIMAHLLGDHRNAREILEDMTSRNSYNHAWPEENVVRGKYYLSQTLKALDDSTAAEMERQAMDDLAKFLKEVQPAGEWIETAKENGEYDILFDYLVHWEFRLVTPRNPSPEAAFAPGSSVSVVDLGLDSVPQADEVGSEVDIIDSRQLSEELPASSNNSTLASRQPSPTLHPNVPAEGLRPVKSSPSVSAKVRPQDVTPSATKPNRQKKDKSWCGCNVL